MLPRIYICIPVHNRIAYTLKCIESIKRQHYPAYQIIICDDGSTDGTSRIVPETHPEVTIVPGDGNLWWTGGTNKCVAAALKSAGDNDFIFTLNNDTEILPDTLENLVKLSLDNGRAILGAVNVYYEHPDQMEPSAFKRTHKYLFKAWLNKVNDWGEPFTRQDKIVAVDALAGKGALIPVEVFQKIGLYDFENLPHYHADTEFTVRAKKAGFQIFLSYNAVVLSHQKLSGTGTANTAPNLKEFWQSFFTIRSAHYLKVLKTYCKILYGKYHYFYLGYFIFRITASFGRRYLLHKMG